MTRRGSALVTSLVTVGLLTTITSAFVARGITQSSILKRQVNSEQAFWVAEAGLNYALDNLRDSSSWTPSGSPYSFGGGTYFIQLVDNGTNLEIRSTGTYNNITRRVKAYLNRVSDTFSNTVSVGGDMQLTGALARVEIYGKTRIGGSYSKTAFASDWFEDRVTSAAASTTCLSVPDYTSDTVANQFNDFVSMAQAIIASYDPSEVAYVVTDGTVVVNPNASLTGVKVVFVQGSAAGLGDVQIWFTTSWADDQDITIISTGTVTYIQPLTTDRASRLSVMAWDDYQEASIFRSQHKSAIFAKDDGNFLDVLDWGSTTGNVIIGDDMTLTEILTYEKFYFDDSIQNGDYPPGFDRLASCGGGASLSTTLTNWQEW